MHPERKAVCPLFNFQISEVLVRKQGKVLEYFSRELRERFEKGIEIIDNVRIRRIGSEDFQRLKSYPALDFLAWLPDVFSRINQRTFVVEFLGKDDSDAPEIESMIYRILLAMRLYKPISVFCKIVWFEENRTINSLIVLDTPLPETSHMVLPYEIPRIEEIEKIRRILEKLIEIDFDKRKSFRIACERFSRAYEEHKEDEILIDFMIAFEALFLRGERAPSNTGQFIGLGCSVLLGNNEKEREEINRFLIKAYNIRNKIVHGSEYKTPIQINNEDYNMRDFVLKLQQSLSESIRKLLD